MAQFPGGDFEGATEGFVDSWAAGISERAAEAIDTAITGEAWNAFRPPSAW
ncbi:hypothetical protein AB0J84_07685 [Micromonospora arborensis]|uniref:hypothetical protein n=1 Tax=Micromonospora arborensis TaxID=2116518 RepID=UPI00341B2B52